MNDNEEQVLHDIDTQLIAITKSINLLKYLTPTNVLAERKEFLHMQGKYNPQFTYNFPAEQDIQGWIAALEDLEKNYFEGKEYTHPMSTLLAQKIDENLISAHLLLAYTKQDFPMIKKYNELLFGPFDMKLVKKSQKLMQSYREPHAETRGKQLNNQEIQQYILQYMKNHNIEGIELAPVEHSAAKFVLFVGDKKCRLVFSEKLQLREHELIGSLIHELGVHYRKYQIGKASGWNILTYGTAYYHRDEEGQAVYEVRKYRQQHYPAYEKIGIYEKYYLLAQTEGKSFSELADLIKQENIISSLPIIFTTIMRMKQGIIHTATKEEGTIFYRNKLYAEGMEKIQTFVAEGNSLEQLFLGKIKIEDLPYLTG